MKRFLLRAAQIAAVVAVAAAIGLGIESCRSRRLAVWVAREGGSFSAAEIPVPEAADFDGGAPDGAVYWNVARFERQGVVYVLAHSYRSWEDLHHRQQSTSTDVCFVVVPGPELPPVRVSGVHLRSEAGLAPPDAVHGFSDRWRVQVHPGAAAPAPEALGRLIPPAVQQELLAAGDLLSGLVVRGRTVRLDTEKTYTTPPYDRLLPLAERLAAHWRR